MKALSMIETKYALRIRRAYLNYGSGKKVSDDLSYRKGIPRRRDGVPVGIASGTCNVGDKLPYRGTGRCKKTFLTRVPERVVTPIWRVL